MIYLKVFITLMVVITGTTSTQFLADGSFIEAGVCALFSAGFVFTGVFFLTTSRTHPFSFK